MRILHVYKDYAPVRGGIENHIKMLAEAQSARGHDVSVLVTNRYRHSRVETINGVRVTYAARLLTVASTPISLALLRCLRHERAEVVHLHFPYPWGEIAHTICGHAGRTVLTYHSDIVRQKYLGAAYAPVLARVLARADAIIATSPNYVVSSPVLARWKQKCIVVPLGIVPRPFTHVDEPAAAVLRGRLVEPTPASPVALFVGALRYYKGLSYLLEALARLPDLYLIVVGVGPMEAEWRQYARTLGVWTRVRFVGEIADADLPAYYAASDIVVLPSALRSEAFGTVQLEAMAAGKAVVCTELGTGTGFVNVDGVTGFVVRARDVGALATAIRRLIDDAGLRARMGAAGRIRVLQEFTLDTMTERVLNVYAGRAGAAGYS